MDDAAISVQAADAATVRQWVNRNEILSVYVRQTSEFVTEHIQRAFLLPGV